MPLTVAQLTARLTADTSGFYRGMAVANSAMVRTGGIASRVFAGIGISVGAGLLLSVREAANFEQSMNVLGAVTHASGRQMARMQAHALALGKDLKLPGVSARDSAEAMTQLAKGGLNVDQTIRATRGTLQLGTAAQISYTEAADMTTRALKMFGLGAGQAGRVANVLAAGANTSTASMVDMAYGLMNAGGTAKLLNVSLEETVGSLAMLVDSGLSGERAGTALSTMFYRLANPTKKAQAAMDEMGISAFDAEGKFRGMQPVIQDFARETANMSEQARLAAFQTIFGLRANQAMMKLLDNAGRKQKQYTKAVTGTNAAQEIAEARMKGFNGMLEKVSNGVSTLAVELGLKLLPWLTKTGTRFADWIAGLDPEEIASAFTRVFGPIMSTLGTLFSFVQANADWLLPLIGGIYAAQKAFLAFRAIAAGIAAVQLMLAAGTLATLAPFLLAAAAVGALVAAFLYAYTNFEGFRNAVNGIVSTVLPMLGAAFQTAVAAIQSAMAWIGANVVPVLMTVAAQAVTAWNAIAEAARAVWSKIGGFVMGGMQMILGIWKGAWTAISAVVPAVWSVIAGFVRNGITIIVNMIEMVASLLRGDWSAAWNNAKAILSAVWDQIKTIVRAAFSALSGILRGGGQAILAVLGAVWSAVKSAAGTAWEAIKTMVRNKVNEIPGVIRGVIGAVLGAAAALGGAIKDGILSGIGGLAGALKDKIVGAAKGALDAAGGFLGISSPSRRAADEIGRPLGAGIIMGFVDGIRDLPAKMNEKLKAALERGKQAITDARSSFDSAFGSLASGMLSAFDAQFANYKTPAEKLLEQMDLEDRIRRINEGIADAQRELNEAIAKGDAEAQAQAQRRLDDALREQTRFELQQQAATERVLADDIIAAERFKMEQRLEEMQKQWARYGVSAGKAQKEVIAMLAAYGIDYRTIGQTLGQALALGLTDALGDVKSAASQIAAEIAKILKTKSPTEEGPMSDLDQWWSGFAETLVAGIKRNSILGALTDAIGAPGAGLGTGGLAAATSVPAVGSGGIVVNVYPEGHVLTERDLVDVVGRGLRDELRRTPGFLDPGR